MKVKAQTWLGTEVEIECQPSTTLGEIKQYIDQRLGVPAACQRVFLEGRFLQHDNWTSEECGFRSGSVLQLGLFPASTHIDMDTQPAAAYAPLLIEYPSGTQPAGETLPERKSSLRRSLPATLGTLVIAELVNIAIMRMRSPSVVDTPEGRFYIGWLARKASWLQNHQGSSAALQAPEVPIQFTDVAKELPWLTADTVLSSCKISSLAGDRAFHDGAGTFDKQMEAISWPLQGLVPQGLQLKRHTAPVPFWSPPSTAAPAARLVVRHAVGLAVAFVVLRGLHLAVSRLQPAWSGEGGTRQKARRVWEAVVRASGQAAREAGKAAAAGAQAVCGAAARVSNKAAELLKRDSKGPKAGEGAGTPSHASLAGHHDSARSPFANDWGSSEGGPEGPTPSDEPGGAVEQTRPKAKRKIVPARARYPVSSSPEPESASGSFRNF